jgi:hypothetical protein
LGGCEARLREIGRVVFGIQYTDNDIEETDDMPMIQEMRESKFLKKEDVGAGSLMTIEGCEQHNVAKEGAPPENKWCLTFVESEKPLVLNSTNAQLCARICESENTDDWAGKKIVLYTDPNVSYAGKIIGGIRVRAPKKTAAVAPKPAPVVDINDDEIPF